MQKHPQHHLSTSHHLTISTLCINSSSLCCSPWQPSPPHTHPTGSLASTTTAACAVSPSPEPTTPAQATASLRRTRWRATISPAHSSWTSVRSGRLACAPSTCAPTCSPRSPRKTLTRSIASTIRTTTSRSARCGYTTASLPHGRPSTACSTCCATRLRRILPSSPSSSCSTNARRTATDRTGRRWSTMRWLRTATCSSTSDLTSP